MLWSYVVLLVAVRATEVRRQARPRVPSHIHLPSQRPEALRAQRSICLTRLCRYCVGDPLAPVRTTGTCKHVKHTQNQASLAAKRKANKKILGVKPREATQHFVLRVDRFCEMYKPDGLEFFDNVWKLEAMGLLEGARTGKFETETTDPLGFTPLISSGSQVPGTADRVAR